ncbi:DNA replication factor C complex subunit Dcc1 [Schizosaccharomyces japonicus yFS275]|uniref:DNA replication factor C complex subunit Dcc1 n=1 Tax=Schizosaccharomyces japonicus (strain yFS275 / FY16936) TaxID=402676 RepID=B6JWM8_SCHJY|nr:DNA replication factor C complex subunit Dcc1 [Schizosaccharomyces japonicus yFS275]EEB05779.1 DNA replication factor C complex subunit Dcc1 [Schizosaccharomyces japonicus yFS275]
MSTEKYHLQYAPEEERLMLMEVNDELLREIESCSDRSAILLKPDKNGSTSVLCTRSKTYAIRQVVQSNSLLLFEKEKTQNTMDLKTRCDIYLELDRIHGTVNLEELLPLWSLDDMNKNLHGIAMKELKVMIPLSIGEIDQILLDECVLFKNGECWRLTPAVICEYIQWICAIYVSLNGQKGLEAEGNWNQLEETAKQDDLDRDILQSVLHGISTTKVPLENQLTCVKLDKQRIAYWFGRKLLLDIVTASPEQFVEQWKQLVPPDVVEEIDLDVLKDLFFISRNGQVQYLSVHHLPTDVSRRFQSLFQLKQKWKYEEIVPFVRDLAFNMEKVEALILKYGRKQTIKGELFINERSSW